MRNCYNTEKALSLFLMLLLSCRSFKMSYLYFILHTVLTTLIISTINVESVRSRVRAQSVLSFLNSFQSDVFLIQECGLPYLLNIYGFNDKTT